MSFKRRYFPALASAKNIEGWILRQNLTRSYNPQIQNYVKLVLFAIAISFFIFILNIFFS